jgi:hypothetical protein
MSVRLTSVAVVLLSAAVPLPALAQSQAEPVPQVFKDVVDCRALTDTAARLACYDRTVSAMADATAKNDLFLADRAKVRETKRTLFGLSLPSLRLFGDNEDISQIDSTITRLSSNARGKWIFTLQDGGRWAQTDVRSIAPKVGDKIVVRRAAMGSFMANVGGARAVRVERLAN